MIRRYLRFYIMTPKGHLSGDTSVVSNVLLPASFVPGTQLRAGKIGLGSNTRRRAAAEALASELRRRPPRYLGVALVLCESVRSGAGRTAHSFVGSYAALGEDKSFVVGDVEAASLDQATSALTECMLDCLRELPGLKLRPRKRV